MCTAIKHPVPDRVKPSFVIFDIRALWRSALSVGMPRCQKLLSPVWHRMLYTSCIHMATVGVEGLRLEGLRLDALMCSDDSGIVAVRPRADSDTCANGVTEWWRWVVWHNVAVSGWFSQWHVTSRPPALGCVILQTDSDSDGGLWWSIELKLVVIPCKLKWLCILCCYSWMNNVGSWLVGLLVCQWPCCRHLSLVRNKIWRVWWEAWVPLKSSPA